MCQRQRAVHRHQRRPRPRMSLRQNRQPTAPRLPPTRPPPSASAAAAAAAESVAAAAAADAPRPRPPPPGPTRAAAAPSLRRWCALPARLRHGDFRRGLRHPATTLSEPHGYRGISESDTLAERALRCWLAELPTAATSADVLSVQMSPALESVLCDYIVDALDAQLHRLAFGARGNGALSRADDAEELEMVREALAAVAGLPPALQERIVRKLRAPSQVLRLALDRGLRAALTASVPTRSHLEFAAPVLEWAASHTASAAHEWWKCRRAFTWRFEQGAALGLVEDQEEFPPCLAAAVEGWAAVDLFVEDREWVAEPNWAGGGHGWRLRRRCRRDCSGCSTAALASSATATTAPSTATHRLSSPTSLALTQRWPAKGEWETQGHILHQTGLIWLGPDRTRHGRCSAR